MKHYAFVDDKELAYIAGETITGLKYVWLSRKHHPASYPHRLTIIVERNISGSPAWYRFQQAVRLAWRAFWENFSRE